jgi:hypothetical protein
VFEKEGKGVSMDPNMLNDLHSAWYVWAGMFIGTALMTIIGTWLITRGWKE